MKQGGLYKTLISMKNKATIWKIANQCEEFCGSILLSEVCVKREDAQAIHVYEKAGFVDSGYIDDTVPDCLNFVYRFVADSGKTDATGR